MMIMPRQKIRLQLQFKVILLTGLVTLLCPGSVVPHKIKLIDQIAMESDISSVQQQVAPPPGMRNPAAYAGFKINPNCKCGVSPKNDDGINEHPWTAAIFYGYKEAPEAKSSMLLFCTGSLINDRYVLTASRCVQGLNASDLQVWLSERNLWSDQNFEQQDHLKKYQVEKLIIHPDFDSSILNHEIALLRLASPVKLSPSFQPSHQNDDDDDANDELDEPTTHKRRRHKRGGSRSRLPALMNKNKQRNKFIFTPVCLPKYDVMAQQDNVTSTYIPDLKGNVVSWDKRGRTSYSLVQTQVPFVNGIDKCLKIMNKNKTENQVILNDNMVCAGDLDQGLKDSCSMDTGSPLVLFENERRSGKSSKHERLRGGIGRRRDEDSRGHYTLVGISSWLYGCTNLENVRLLYDVIFPNNTAKPQVPGVFTRVERYRDWITHNTLDAVWCA